MNLTQVFKLLSDETRLRTIMLIREEALCVCELCGILEEPQPKISKIIGKLKDMNLVKGSRKEKFIFYKLNEDNLLFNDLLMQINNHRDDYHYLIDDKKRLSNKEDYVDACALQSLKDLNKE
jgi:ArsR family transcriptional regulator